MKQVALDGNSYQHVWDQSGMAYLVSAFASENGLHHILDVSDGEDASRIRNRSAPNFSRLRRLTLNMLKTERSVKDSMAGKRQRCTLSREYRLQAIAANLGTQTAG